MTYWRMQLHPADPQHAIKHTIESLAAGYIGLDFGQDVGDLTKTKKEKLPKGQGDYWAFAHEMKVGHIVLIIVHHYPFALATISRKYNYIREKAPELGVSTHFRKVKNVKYYADYQTDAKKWQPIVMTDTIAPLRDPKTVSYRLIDQWK